MSFVYFVFLVLIGGAAFGLITRRRIMVVISGGRGLGALTYYLSGIAIVGYLGRGRFYSIPFGGYKITGQD